MIDLQVTPPLQETMAIPQIRAGFRVAAFVECLVKLALHRLGSKGGDDWVTADPGISLIIPNHDHPYPAINVW